VVLWSRPAAQRDKEHLRSWCAGVGPLLFRTPVSGDLRDTAPIDDLLVVSWNVHVGTADIDRFVTDLRAGRLSDGRRPGHIILLLQEAVRSRDVPSSMPAGASAARAIASNEAIDRNDIERLSSAQHMSVLYAPSMRDGGSPGSGRRPADRGNAILSTLPLSDPVAIELPGERQRRVAIAASIQLDAADIRTRLSIVVAHFDALRGPRALWIIGTAAARDKQADALTHALPDGPAIMGADLNSWTGTREPVLRGLFRLFPSTPSGPSQATVREGLVLDYLFFRLPPNWRAHVKRAPERYGSDHYPLVGSLSF